MPGFDYSRANKRWQHLRKLALKRDKHRCQEAARYGITSGPPRITRNMRTAFGISCRCRPQRMTGCMIVLPVS